LSNVIRIWTKTANLWYIRLQFHSRPFSISQASETRESLYQVTRGHTLNVGNVHNCRYKNPKSCTVCTKIQSCSVKVSVLH